MAVVSSRWAIPFLSITSERHVTPRSHMCCRSRTWLTRPAAALQSNPVVWQSFHFYSIFVICATKNITVFICSAVILLVTKLYFHLEKCCFFNPFNFVELSEKEFDSLLTRVCTCGWDQASWTYSFRNLNPHNFMVEIENVTESLQNFDSFL